MNAGSQRPRLVQLLHFDRAEGGSFALMIAGVLRAAVARGWEAHVGVIGTDFDRPWLADLEATGAEVHVAPAELADDRGGQVRWLREQIPPGGPTVMHTHFTTWDIAARRVAPEIGKPSAVFWHVHSALSTNPAVVARTIFKFAVLGRGVDGFLCPAPNQVDGVRRRLAPRGRVHFLPSALDTSRFPLLDDERRAAARAELGLPADAWVLLHFGWHTYLKGTDRFLEMLATLPEHRGRPVHALIRGGGEETADLAAELGVSERARAQGPIDEIATLFGAADALVAASRNEGMAYSVLESLCSGTPVVATDIPGHAYIADGANACTTVEHSPEALAAGVRKMLNRTPDRVQADAEQSRRWVVDELGIEVIGERLLGMYSQALGLPADPG